MVTGCPSATTPPDAAVCMAAITGRFDGSEAWHTMSSVFPNIFETSPHVINSVMEAIEGMRCVLGPTKVLQYTLQGLFHPARKVREVYWKIYNNLYIGSQAALVPAYPRMTDDVLNQYTRSHLELFL